MKLQIDFYSKDEFSKGMMGLGEIHAKLTGEASFAEFAFGRGAMAWDELQAHDFIRDAKDKKFISAGEREHLMKATKSEVKNVAWRTAEYAAIMLAIMILIRPLSQAGKG